jgi:hypothetical protein
MTTLRVVFFVILSVLVWLIVSQYLFCPQYCFKSGHPFTGQRFYNPYQDIKDDCNWIKSNLHTHTKSWDGLTDGQGTAKQFRKIYNSMNYGVLGFSNYQVINNSLSSVPVYEHGYNLKKVHQLVVGGSRVTWLDYIFPQTRSNKQYLLKQMGSADNAIILAHPALRDAYSDEDLKFLSGYQCIEMLNPAEDSFSQWDAALSAGNAVFAVGDDDIHNINNPARLAKNCTFLNLPDGINPVAIVAAIKQGRGYAMKIGMLPGEGTEQRRERIKSKLPCLKYCRLDGDYLKVKFSTVADRIQFSGDGGAILSVRRGQDSGTYKLKPGNSYVRASAFFPDGTKIYLNPVFRTNGKIHTWSSSCSVNRSKSILFSLAGIFILFSWASYMLKMLNLDFLNPQKLRKKISSAFNIGLPSATLPKREQKNP